MDVTNQEVMNVTSYIYETVPLSNTKPVCEHDGCLKFATKMTDGGDGRGAIKVCGMHTRERIKKKAEKKRARENQAEEKKRVKMQKRMEKTTDNRKVADRLFDDECPICLGGNMWKYASQGMMLRMVKDAFKTADEEEEEKPFVLKPQLQRIGQVMVLPCKHLLHTECMNKMIGRGRHSCPLCSKEFGHRVLGQAAPKALELSNDIILRLKGEKADLMRETVNSISKVVNTMTTDLDGNEMTDDEVSDGVGAIMA